MPCRRSRVRIPSAASRKPCKCRVFSFKMALSPTKNLSKPLQVTSHPRSSSPRPGMQDGTNHPRPAPRAEEMPNHPQAPSWMRHYRDDRSPVDRRMPMWRHPIRAHRTGLRRRLLSLHSLPTPNRHRSLTPCPDRRRHIATATGSRSSKELATPRRRPREVLLRQLWVASVQPQPRASGTDERAFGRL